MVPTALGSWPGGPFATALSSQLLATPHVRRMDGHFGGAKVFVAAEVLQRQLGVAASVNGRSTPGTFAKRC